eukprot:661763-Pelagomonas_calceolata.AAC.6
MAQKQARRAVAKVFNTHLPGQGEIQPWGRGCKGFWKTPGERNPGLRPLGFSHWVGPKQYSWLEWLIPDNEPPALVSSADIRVNARYWVLEALPASVWPCNGNILRDGYNFLGFDDPNATAAKDKAIREPRWQALHSMAEASCLSEDCTYTLPASTPACKAFRLRLLEASEPGSDHLAAGLQLKVWLFKTIKSGWTSAGTA